MGESHETLKYFMVFMSESMQTLNILRFSWAGQ